MAGEEAEVREGKWNNSNMTWTPKDPEPGLVVMPIYYYADLRGPREWLMQEQPAQIHLVVISARPHSDQALRGVVIHKIDRRFQTGWERLTDKEWEQVQYFDQMLFSRIRPLDA